MNTYRIGTVLIVAIALVIIPGQKSFAARKRQPAQQQQSQTNARPNPNDPGGHSAKGFEFAKKKEYDKAIAEFTEAINADPKDAMNYFNRATAYRGAGKMDEARAEFDSKETLQRFAPPHPGPLPEGEGETRERAPSLAPETAL